MKLDSLCQCRKKCFFLRAFLHLTVDLCDLSTMTSLVLDKLVPEIVVVKLEVGNRHA